MKYTVYIIVTLIALSLGSCNLFEEDKIDGEQSTMGEVGAVITGSTAEGVEDASATVIALEDGVSTFSGEATITNPAILNAVSNMPEFTVVGNKVTVTGLKFKITTEGVESMVPSYPGTIVKYSSKVGDKYKVGSTGVEREVISKSTEDEYPYGFWLIKVIKVEESPSVIPGVSKLVYVANHKFGIVGLDVTFDDNSTFSFITMGNTENN